MPADMQPLFQQTQKLFQLDVIHYGDDVPIQYEKRWVDAELVPEFSQQDLTQVNASDYLIDNVPLVRGHYNIQAKHPTGDIADKLDMTTEQAALVLTRYTYSSDNRIVTYVQMWHNGDNFQFSGAL